MSVCTCRSEEDWCPTCDTRGDEAGQLDWEYLRDVVTPPPFPHNQAAWTVMARLLADRINAHRPIGETSIMTDTEATALAGELRDHFPGGGQYGARISPGMFNRILAALHPPAAPEPSNLHKTQIAPAAPATGEVVEGFAVGIEDAARVAERYPSSEYADIAVIRGIAAAIRALNGGS